MSSENVQSQIEVLLKRVDELESRAKLRDLVSDYCLGFDNHDWDTFISIWHDDAVWEIGPPFGTFTGHEEIKNAVYEILYPFWRETHHLTTNLRIEFSDSDHASGICNVDCMGASNEGGVVQMVNATYIDEYTRRVGVWKIARRKVDLHYFNPIPGVEMSPPA
ncbi:MAG: nuclear transport factor 2 family protein [Gammaproteobacteria bacterium]|nr:nuclear transport factor 2 family protein [Gammaproteobacteria bacterium]